jgi:hypothetical protein
VQGSVKNLSMDKVAASLLLTSEASPRVATYIENWTCFLDSTFAIGPSGLRRVVIVFVWQRKLAVLLFLPLNVRNKSILLPSSREGWRLAMDTQQCRLYIQSVSLLAPDFTLFGNGSIGGARVSGWNYW